MEPSFVRELVLAPVLPLPSARADDGARTSRSQEPNATVAGLLATAQETRQAHPRRVWDPDAPLVHARNAHHSNTAEQMREALTSDAAYNWLEGDLRMSASGELVMAHDADQEGNGLTLAQWLRIGAASGRGLKVDVKEDAALPKLLAALEASGIPQGRLMINVGALPEGQVRQMREQFPDAWLALNPRASEGASGYGAAALDEVVEAAQAAGGRVAFPVRWDLVDDALIKRLEPHGDVSIWTSGSQATPDDTAGETRALRERGVRGVIDLGPPSSLKDKLLQRGMDVWESRPSRTVRDGVDAARDGAGALAERAKDGAGIVAGGVRRGAGAVRDFVGDAPLIGRLL